MGSSSAAYTQRGGEVGSGEVGSVSSASSFFPECGTEGQPQPQRGGSGHLRIVWVSSCALASPNRVTACK